MKRGKKEINTKMKEVVKIRTFVSKKLGYGLKGHSQFEFVDICLNHDNKIFIDPLLILYGNSLFCNRTKGIVEVYFKELIQAYRENRLDRVRELFQYGGEINHTKTGYGNGRNGHGSTVEGLIKIFKEFPKILKEVPFIDNVEDLVIYLPGFAEDKMTDLLVNILHDQLNDFTISVAKKRGMKDFVETEFWTFDEKLKKSIKVKRESLVINGEKILLCPKEIVTNRYIFGAEDFFRKIIIESEREKGEYRDMKGNPLPKKDVIQLMSKKGKPDWRYHEIRKNEKLLAKYHTKLFYDYRENARCLTDEELDEILYKKEPVKLIG